MYGPGLETPRLLLRPLTEADAPAAFLWQSDPKVNRFMSYTLYQSVAETVHFITEIAPRSRDYNWGFVYKENNLLIGSGSIGYRPEQKAYSFGYNLRADYWNRGLTTEAAKAMIRFAFEELGARDFCADHAVGNPASGRVMEKCGLKFDHFGSYAKLDGSETFAAKYYRMHLDSLAQYK